MKFVMFPTLPSITTGPVAVMWGNGNRREDEFQQLV